MSTHRYKVHGPTAAQIAQMTVNGGFVSANDFGSVDVDLNNDVDKADLDAFMESIGYSFVETDPQQPTTALQSVMTATFGAGPVNQAAPGDTPTVDWALGQKQQLVLDDNVTGITFLPPPGTANLMLVIKQPSVGGPFTMTGYPAAVLWAGGTEPVLSTAADAIDILSFYFDGTNYFGQFALDFK